MHLETLLTYHHRITKYKYLIYLHKRSLRYLCLKIRDRIKYVILQDINSTKGLGSGGPLNVLIDQCLDVDL